MNNEKQTLDMIEQITRNDGTKYYELANIVMNGRAEKAAELGLIKEVRILKLNIPHSSAVGVYEDYVNQNYTVPPMELTEWVEYKKPEGKVLDAFNEILKANHIATEDSAE
ncbi:hypothetical protein C5L30_001631 [Companilactobacillus farciminis]|uniref:Uncharacterized protein n=1 Tax=Companilactobacillus farciminis TaxID=1612 RepID=A0A4R5NE95_9LACO|nr:hypothetical protein [Companilactobacillus farciminis]ATO46923.1 hypothetical protein LF20184_09320 [Companilactobacillus farciminis KCTC 3681 = DSM 20184]KRK61319.1 hypothetical protein FC68_GL001180 [Companilactobacillus farciminis KCTC 3681 = DSM 20184]TDG71934.1 hypothetical protein C5L30_001631 [Companilactobacillus farciminis]